MTSDKIFQDSEVFNSSQAYLDKIFMAALRPLTDLQ